MSSFNVEIKGINRITNTTQKLERIISLQDIQADLSRKSKSNKVFFSFKGIGPERTKIILAKIYNSLTGKVL